MDADPTELSPGVDVRLALERVGASIAGSRGVAVLRRAEDARA